MLIPKIADLPRNHLDIMIDKPNFDFAKTKDLAELKKKETIPCASMKIRGEKWEKEKNQIH